MFWSDTAYREIVRERDREPLTYLTKLTNTDTKNI